MSGLPLIGTAILNVAGILGFGTMPTAVIGLVALALDTGGLPWFLVVTWHDKSFWDSNAKFALLVCDQGRSRPFLAQ